MQGPFNFDDQLPTTPNYTPGNQSNPDWVNKEIADNPPSKLLSIDPGFTNLGYVKAEYTIVPWSKPHPTINIHFTELGTWKISDDAKGSVPEFSTRVASFFNHKYSRDEDLIATCVLIEQQYNRPDPKATPGQRFFYQQLQVLYQALHAYASGLKCFVDTIHPSSVKAHFKTKGVDYEGNKEAAVNFCKEKLQISSGDSHQADAILQACCYLQSQYPDYALNVSCA